MRDLPPDFAEALKAAGLEAFFADCTGPHQREYLNWIAGAKRPATRIDRIQKAVTMIADKKSAEDGRTRKRARQ